MYKFYHIIELNFRIVVKTTFSTKQSEKIATFNNFLNNIKFTFLFLMYNKK